MPIFTPNYERGFGLVMRAEGGATFTDDPHDKGGATKYGLSLRAVRLRDHDKDGKLDFDLDHDGVVTAEDIRQIPEELAKQVYFEDYWSLGPDTLHVHTCDDFPELVALAMFDSAVNMGPRAAVAVFQRSMGLKEDGIVGDQTLGAARRKFALEMFMAERSTWYSKLDDAKFYLKGWNRRLFLLIRSLYLKEAA